MKRIFYNIAVVLSLCVAFTACENQIENEILEDRAGVGTLLLSSESVEILKSTELGVSYKMSDISSVVLTIEKDGAVVDGFDSKEVEVGSWGDDAISIAGLDLANGTGYEITAFELKNSDETTTFASPKINSAVAGWVDTVLPISFNIADAETTILDLQVVTTLGSTAERFGYDSFALTGEAASVANYLASFENVFLSDGDSVVHIFSDRGIPTYSEVYRSHYINSSVITDFVGVTFRHYYVDGNTPVERLDRTYSGNQSFEEIETFQIETDEATSAIIEIEKSDYREIYSTDGLLTEAFYMDNAGNVNSRYDYTYSEDNRTIESKQYNSNDQLTKSAISIYDVDGNVTEFKNYDEEGSLTYRTESFYENSLITEFKYYRIIDQEDELSSNEMFAYSRSLTYSEDGLLLEDTYDNYDELGEIYSHSTKSYKYNGDVPISYVETGYYYDNVYESEYAVDEMGSRLGSIEPRDDMTFVSNFKGVLVSCSYLLDGDSNMTIYISTYGYSYSLTNSEGVVTKIGNQNSSSITSFSETGAEIGSLNLNSSEFFLDYMEAEGVSVPTLQPSKEADFKLLSNTSYYSESYSDSDSDSTHIVIEGDGDFIDSDSNYGVKLYEYEYTNDGSDEIAGMRSISILHSGSQESDEISHYIIDVYDLETGETSSTKYSPTGEVIE